MKETITTIEKKYIKKYNLRKKKDIFDTSKASLPKDSERMTAEALNYPLRNAVDI